MKVSKQSRWADSPGGLLASLVPTSGNFYQFGDDAAARMSGEESSRYGSLAATEAAQNLGGCATDTEIGPRLGLLWPQ